MSKKYNNLSKFRKDTKINQKIKKEELALIDPEAYRTRCQLQLARYREVRTYGDVVQLLEDAINGMLSDAIDIKKSNALGYLGAVSLTAIKMQKSEKTPSDRLSERLRMDDVTLNMTEEELKSLAYATNTNIQINIFNKAANRTDLVEVVPEPLTIDAHIGKGEFDNHGILSTALRKADNLNRGIEVPDEELIDFTPPEPPKD